jgi:hypothetical protein
MSSRATPAKATASKNACFVKTVHQQEAFLNLVNTSRPFARMNRTQGVEWRKIAGAMNKDEMFVYNMSEANVKPTFVRLMKEHRAEQNREKGRTGCDNTGPPTAFDTLKDELADMYDDSLIMRETKTVANEENRKRIAEENAKSAGHLVDAMQTFDRTKKKASQSGQPSGFAETPLADESWPGYTIHKASSAPASCADNSHERNRVYTNTFFADG